MGKNRWEAEVGYLVRLRCGKAKRLGYNLLGCIEVGLIEVVLLFIVDCSGHKVELAIKTTDRNDKRSVRVDGCVEA